MDREAALGEQQRAQELARARQQSEQIVADAKRQAAETVSAARRQVEGLGRQRDGIRDDLAKLQRRLTAAVDAMAHMGEEDDAEAARPTGPAATTVRLPDAAAAAPRPRPTD
jgi:hypothetical protein